MPRASPVHPPEPGELRPGFDCAPLLLLRPLPIEVALVGQLGHRPWTDRPGAVVCTAFPTTRCRGSYEVSPEGMSAKPRPHRRRVSNRSWSCRRVFSSTLEANPECCAKISGVGFPRCFRFPLRRDSPEALSASGISRPCVPWGGRRAHRNGARRESRSGPTGDRRSWRTNSSGSAGPVGAVDRLAGSGHAVNRSRHRYAALSLRGRSEQAPVRCASGRRRAPQPRAVQEICPSPEDRHGLGGRSVSGRSVVRALTQGVRRARVLTADGDQNRAWP